MKPNKRNIFKGQHITRTRPVFLTFMCLGHLWKLGENYISLFRKMYLHTQNRQ